MRNYRIVRSTGRDVWRNLALEERLVQQADPGETVLYLWRNDPAVIVGRHQVPWAECSVATLDREGVRLARRISGGGAVYHDLGNLNFTFITGRDVYDLPGQVRLIREAVRSLGADAELSPRNDLLVSGGKVSGNSSWLGKAVACHHGTLLVASDLARLGRYLEPAPLAVTSNIIKSVRSPVTNLADACPGLTVDDVEDAIIRAFGGASGAGVADVYPSSYPELDQLAARHASWEWRFGKTPRFEVAFTCAGGPDEGRAVLTVGHGCIERVKLEAGAGTGTAAELNKALCGVRFQQADMGSALAGVADALRDPAVRAVAECLARQVGCAIG